MEIPTSKSKGPLIQLPCNIGDKVFIIIDDDPYCEACPLKRKCGHRWVACDLNPCPFTPFVVEEHVCHSFVVQADGAGNIVAIPYEMSDGGFEQITGIDYKQYYSLDSVEAALKMLLRLARQTKETRGL
jgi:hypothetical protein